MLTSMTSREIFMIVMTVDVIVSQFVNGYQLTVFVVVLSASSHDLSDYIQLNQELCHFLKNTGVALQGFWD